MLNRGAKAALSPCMRERTQISTAPAAHPPPPTTMPSPARRRCARGTGPGTQQQAAVDQHPDQPLERRVAHRQNQSSCISRTAPRGGTRRARRRSSAVRRRRSSAGRSLPWRTPPRPGRAPHGQRHVQPDPGQHHMAEGLQVGRGVGQRLLGLAGGPGRLRGGAQLLQRRGQFVGRARPGRRTWPARCDRGADARGQQLQARAAVHHHLAAQQVQRLDAVRALVDHVQAVVAPVLLDREVARVAVAAQHLDRQAVGLQAPLAGPALGDRRQHLQQQPGLPRGRAVAGVLLVDQPRAVQLERQRAFGIAFCASSMRLTSACCDDRHLRLRGVLAAPDRSAGPAAAGARNRGTPRSRHSRASSAPMPTPMRASFIMWNMQRRPSPGRPTR